MTMIWRVPLGVVLAAAVAVVAKRAGSLSASGAAAATVVGASAVAAGWEWGALLFAYFVASTLLSRLGRDVKAARAASIVAKSGARDGAQVAANGVVFAASAVAMCIAPSA